MQGIDRMIIFPKGLTDKGTTPKWFFDVLDKTFNFNFDPCPFEWDKSFDGLKIDWKERNYCNPPYSEKLPWVKKSIEESNKGKLVVMFLPVDTSTRWFKLLLENSFIIFIGKRVKSNIGKTPAFSSLIAIMNGKNKGLVTVCNPDIFEFEQVTKRR